MIQKSILFTFCFLITLVVNAQTKNLANFTELSTAGGVRVELIKSTENKLEYKMLKGKETDLVTEIKDNKLTIKIKNKFGIAGAKAEVKLYYKSLQAVFASAGSSIQSKETIESNAMQIHSSSGSRISLMLNANSAVVDASSGSNISLSGSISGLTAFEASSGAHIEAASLSTNSANVEASSGSHVSVWATNKINAGASSGGNIRYKGQPAQIETDKSSGGNVSKI